MHDLHLYRILRLLSDEDAPTTGSELPGIQDLIVDMSRKALHEILFSTVNFD